MIPSEWPTCFSSEGVVRRQYRRSELRGQWTLRTVRPLAHMVRLAYDSRVMLSRAQETRVQDILASGAPGTLRAYCLEGFDGGRA
jgi:hypothetical protein